MSALSEGVKAPDFTVPTLEGKEFSFSGALSQGPVVLAFFKISCPVCQYALPYLERMYKTLRARGVSLVGISQDNSKDTREFVRMYGVTFPIGIDDEKNRFRVSDAYGLTNVPTILEIAKDHTILTSSVGWDRRDIEGIYAHYTDGDLAAVPLFQPGESVADLKVG